MIRNFVPFCQRITSSSHTLKSLNFSTKLNKTDFDVVIVGGGAVGANVAYHLALIDQSLSICVVERDFSYTSASAVLSAAGIRQQFSLAANIELSKYGVDFLKNASKDLFVKGCDVPDMQFKEQGYLFLASPEYEDTLRKNNATQENCGVDWMSLLTPNELSKRFPWLKTDGVALGSMSEKSEGWFDPWALLSNLNMKSKSMGVTFIQGEVSSFICEKDEGEDTCNKTTNRLEGYKLASKRKINKVILKKTITGSGGKFETCSDVLDNNMNNNDIIELGAGIVVNAAGPFAQKIASACGEDVMKVPVEARKRSIFHVHCNEGLNAGGANDEGKGNTMVVPGYKTTPLVVCPESGAYFRPEGGNNYFICGVSPYLEEHVDENCHSYQDLDCSADNQLYENVIWPSLYDRCEALGNLKVKSSWVGFYEYNTLDQNAIIGYHPEVTNLMLCNGFSGHGLQQSMGSGRAVAEIIKYKESTSVDIDCFSFDRIVKNEPLYEQNIV